ncbi:MAG: 3-phosphoshikimate 1-carboxyvinyltransferase [Proteobacteria bacterium]|nr:3-phosphoshikimate 1-carboxyvinyltransferase [Desulfobacula sp.]MBU4132132.1 3-phosphoshikimate 1-carboxyvinyltransferase [Pseudomonadota bacterium]
MKQIQSRHIPDQIVQVPGSKSISHRMLICASLSEGTSKIRNLLKSQDLTLTAQALSAMGAGIKEIKPGLVEVHGFNGRPIPHTPPIFLGNSGTSMRLLAGIAALGTSIYTLTGDERMCQRPMTELLEALKMIQVDAHAKTPGGSPPVHIQGLARIGGHTTIDCSKSSQYLSALLMIGPFMEKGLTISLPGPPVSVPYIDLTIDVMSQFNVNAVKINDCRYQVAGGQKYDPGEYVVEPDLSNAGYFWAAGAVTKALIGVDNIPKNSLQGDKKQIHILEKMGCSLNIQDTSLAVKGNTLAAVDVDMSDTPDAVPAIAVVAAFARGTTRIRNIGHLRIKECDRIEAIASQLTKMGIDVTQGDDWIEVTGGTPKGAFIETFNDHRIAMAFSVAGLVVKGMEIENPSCVEKSFPGYWSVFDRL